MKKTKKFLSIIMALIMVITIIPMSVFTTSAETISGTCGDNLTWTFDDETGVLTVSGMGDMYNYEWDYDFLSYFRPWEDYEDNIISIFIEEGVASIGSHAFDSCESIENVTIGDSVTTIGDYAFYYCTSLTSVIIPDSVISIGSYAFYSSDNITSLTIGNSVTTIEESAFESCTSLDSVIIPDSLKTIGKSAFESCTSLDSVTIPDSVTSIEIDAFKNTAYYNDANNWYNDVFYIDNYLIESKNDISGEYIIKDGTLVISDYALAGCDNLISVIIPDSVTSIGSHAFYSSDNITSLTIGNGVTTIGESAFESCTSLDSVIIPDSVTSIGREGFAYCESLTSVIIPDSVKSIGDDVFYRCYSLTSITVDTDNEYYSSDEYGVLFNKDKTELIQYPTGNTRTSYSFPDSVISIDAWAFHKSESLTNIIISNSVTRIEDSVFEGCTSLLSVVIPNSVTVIGRCSFEKCTSLLSVVIPNSVTLIGYGAFYNCTKLTDVYYCGTEEQWNDISMGVMLEPLLNATLHYHNYVDGTCTICGENKMIIETMTSQIRFNTTLEKAYTGTFDVRTRVKISDEDFKELVGETNAEAIENIDKIGFVYTINGENFSAESAKEVAQGGSVAGYVDAPVKSIQDSDGYYMFTCLVTGIPETDNNYVLTAYAYICVNGKWYVSEAPMDADFEVLYDTYYPVAAEKYGWEA